MKKLKPNTNYSITVRLFNAAGFSERKATRKTASKSYLNQLPIFNREFLDYASRCKGPCPPNIWIIMAIIASIIAGTILVLVVMIRLTKCKKNPRNSTEF